MVLSKYFKWYNQIIDKALSEKRLKNNGVYYERHHIIPKTCGGDNSKSNLVLLTGREHYLCHYLLTKFAQKDQNNKMVHAFNMMCNCNTSEYSNSVLYEKNRIRRSEILSIKNTGKRPETGIAGQPAAQCRTSETAP